MRTLVLTSWISWKDLHPWKLTWHWKITIFNRKYIFKWWIFHCHVRFRKVFSIPRNTSDQRHASAMPATSQHASKASAFSSFEGWKVEGWTGWTNKNALENLVTIVLGNCGWVFGVKLMEINIYYAPGRHGCPIIQMSHEKNPPTFHYTI